ncbi:MAG: thrombospondin type 3 repeat-containing protein [bacterium]
MRSNVVVAGLLALLALGGFGGAEAAIPPGASAQSLAVHLPSPQAGQAAVWSGTHAYIFGGEASLASASEVVDFDPVAGTTTVMPAHLPTWRTRFPAVWAGSVAYLFGGWGDSGDNNVWDTILAFDPAGGGSFTTMKPHLPYGLTDSMAVWTGSKAYVFGGWENVDGAWGTWNYNIYEFDPAAQTVATLALRMPVAVYAGAAVWDGSAAYAIGGWDGTGPIASQRILRFVPPSGVSPGSVTILPASLPDDVAELTAVWDGSRAIIMGGRGGWNHPNEPSAWIGAFDPAAMTVQSWPTPLPYGEYGAPSVYDMGAGCAYLFGGQASATYGAAFRNDIVAIGPPRCHPSLPPPPPPPSPPPSPPPPPEPEPLACSPSFRTLAPGSSATWQATGGTPPYAWDPFEGDDDGQAAMAVMTRAFSEVGNYTITVRDQGDPPTTATCAVSVRPPAPEVVVCRPASQITAVGAYVSIVQTGAAQPVWDAPGAAVVQPGSSGIVVQYAEAGDYAVTVGSAASDGQSSCNVVVRDDPGDRDSDMDGVADGADNCPAAVNRDQGDADRDGIGDACDTTAPDVPGEPAAEPTAAVPPPDADLDAIPDAVDDCPRVADRMQRDMDGDGMGDLCDADLDGDGIANDSALGGVDNCPTVPNPAQEDVDGNGLGDACSDVTKQAGRARPPPSAVLEGVAHPNPWPALAAWAGGTLAGCAPLAALAMKGARKRRT